MTRLDNKHHLDGEQIVKTDNGVPIDLDKEPVILFRARDPLALATLRYYRRLCAMDGCTDFQMRTIDDSIRGFDTFAIHHPDEMKQPGITRGL